MGSSQKAGHGYPEMRYLGRRLWGHQSQVIERVLGQELAELRVTACVTSVCSCACRQSPSLRASKQDAGAGIAFGWCLLHGFLEAIC